MTMALRPATANCERCGKPFTPAKLGHRFCSTACRTRMPKPEDERRPGPEVLDCLLDPTADPYDRVIAGLRIGDPVLAAKTLRESGHPDVLALFGTDVEPIPDAPFDRDRYHAVLELAESHGFDNSFGVLDLYTEMIRPGWSPFPVPMPRASLS